LIRARGCEHTQLAYWANSQPVSTLEINFATPNTRLRVGDVKIPFDMIIGAEAAAASPVHPAPVQAD
jgi:hypothetical protein